MAEINFNRYSGLSAVMSGFPFMRADKSDPLDQVPTTYLAMLETLDGCIKFIEQREPTPQIRQLITKAVWTEDHSVSDMTEVAQRVYNLIDRAGPQGMILHYRESSV